MSSCRYCKKTWKDEDDFDYQMHKLPCYAAYMEKKRRTKKRKKTK